MKKLGIRLVIKMLDRHTKIKFEDDDSSGAYDHEENTVFIGSNCGNKELQVAFQKHIRNKHHYDSAHKFSATLWTILHEMGHHFTSDDFDESIEDEEAPIRAMCAMIPLNEAMEKGIEDTYYDLPTEFAATEWAINFIKSHPRKARLFDLMVR